MHDAETKAMLFMTEQNQSHVVKAECFKLSTAMAAEKTLLTALTFYTWIHGFVSVVTWICQSCYIHFSPFAKQVQAEV